MRKKIGKITIDIHDEENFNKYTRIKPLYKYEKIHELIKNEFFYLDQTDIFDFYRYDVRLRRNIGKYLVMFEEYLRALIGNQYLNEHISMNNLNRFANLFGNSDKDGLKRLLKSIIEFNKITRDISFSEFLELTTLGSLLQIMELIKLNNDKMYFLPEYVNKMRLSEVRSLRNYVYHQRFLWECYQNSTANLSKGLTNFAKCLPVDFRNNFINEINNSIKGLRISSKYTIELESLPQNDEIPRYLYKYYSEKEYNFNAVEKGYLYLSKAKDFNDPNDSMISIDFNDSTSYLFDLFVNEYIKEMKRQNFAQKIIDSTEQLMLDQEKRSEAIEMFKKNDNKSFKDLLLNEAKYRAIDINENISKIFTDISDIFDKSQKDLENHEDKIKEELNNIFEYLRKNEYYIGCLTNNSNSVLMWTHYSNNHNGFLVKLELDKSYTESVYPVKYSNKKPLRGIEELHKSTEENVLKFFKREFYTKAKDWQYEKEYRLIINEQEGNEFYGIKVVEIILGYNISDQNKKRLANYCRKNNIQLKKATLRTQSYGVKYENIDINEILSHS